MTKLTDKIVIEARRRAQAGELYQDLAAAYGVSRRGIVRAIRGETWTHLDDLAAPVPERRGRWDRRNAALTDEIVVLARRRAKDGETITHLAHEYGTSPQNLGYAIRGKTWTHLDAIEAPAPGAYKHRQKRVTEPTPKSTGKTLTDEIVIDARRRVKRGERIPALAKEIGISPNGLDAAVHGTRWVHLNSIEAPATRLGNAFSKSKLTDEQAIDARRRVKAGVSRSGLAAEYEVSLATLCNAVNGTTYSHLNTVEAPLPKTSTRDRRSQGWEFDRNF